MNNVSRGNRLRLWLALVVLAGSCLPVQAGEPAQAFLKRLRERDYHDMAIEYLDRMQKSDLVSPEFKSQVQYERAMISLEASRTQRDLKIRQKSLDDARDAFERYSKNAPNPLKAIAARTQLGTVLVDRGHIKLEESKQTRADAAKLREEARAFYKQAYDTFVACQTELSKQLDSLDKTDPKIRTIREEYRAERLQNELLAAAVTEESAETYDKKDPIYLQTLEQAAKENGEIHSKHRTLIAGLYARMFQARCNQKMAKFKEALTFSTELLEQPNDPAEFRTLKTKVMLLAMECWTHPSQNLHAEAVVKGSAWLAEARPSDHSPDWLNLRMAVARASKVYAEQLLAKDAKDKTAKTLFTDARKQAQLVLKQGDNDKQKEARAFLASLPGTVGASSTSDDKSEINPRTFAEACDGGKEQVEIIKTNSLVAEDSKKALATATDPEDRKELKQQLDEATKALADANDRAFKYFNAALRLVDKDSPVEEVNNVRYFLSYLHYAKNDLMGAAVMAEFLARRYPDAAGARPAANIARACYLRLYVENKDDNEFETRRVISLCEFIAEKWADQTEGVEAINTLIPFLIKADQLEKARTFVQRIPVTSPQRGDAELKCGQAMWSSYLRGIIEVQGWKKDGTQPEGLDVAKREAELAKTKEAAQQVLSDGIARMKDAGKIDASMAASVLSLAQIFLDTEQAPKAVALLEDATIGVLPLVKKGHEAVSKPGFAAETYKTALRAYIAGLAAESNPAAMIQKAKDTMDALKKSVGTSDQDQERLIAIYVSLAKDLEQQMKLIGSPVAKKAMSQGFETFLKQVGADAKEFNVVNWVAETFFSLGEAFDTNKAKLTPEAKAYFEQALAAYDRIIAEGTKTPGWIKPPEMLTRVRHRSATAKRRLGRYKDAVDDLFAILKEQNSLVNVQIESAKTYSEWAMSGSPDSFAEALRGSYKREPHPKTRKPVIWGWVELSNKTARDPKFREGFFEIRYNLALNHLQYARRKKDVPADYKKNRDYARTDLEMTVTLFPEAASHPQWSPLMERLYKDILKECGEQDPKTLKELAAKAEKAKSAPPPSAPQPTTPPPTTNQTTAVTPAK